MTEPGPAETLTYPEAMAELETILDRLEHDQPDVDRVAADVARAAELVQHCRSRIAAARVQVEEVVADLVPGTESDEADPPEPSES